MVPGPESSTRVCFGANAFVLSGTCLGIPQAACVCCLGRVSWIDIPDVRAQGISRATSPEAEGQHPPCDGPPSCRLGPG